MQICCHGNMLALFRIPHALSKTFALLPPFYFLSLSFSLPPPFPPSRPPSLSLSLSLSLSPSLPLSPSFSRAHTHKRRHARRWLDRVQAIIIVHAFFLPERWLQWCSSIPGAIPAIPQVSRSKQISSFGEKRQLRMSCFIIISKSELPLCEAIGGPQERCPLNCTPGIKTTFRPSLIRCN